jgi:hypothetical protein
MTRRSTEAVRRSVVASALSARRSAGGSTRRPPTGRRALGRARDPGDRDARAPEGHLAFLVDGTDCFTATACSRAPSAVRGRERSSAHKASIMERLMGLPHETRIHRPPRALDGRGRGESNPFIRPGAARRGAGGALPGPGSRRPSCFLGPDYDGTTRPGCASPTVRRRSSGLPRRARLARPHGYRRRRDVSAKPVRFRCAHRRVARWVTSADHGDPAGGSPLVIKSTAPSRCTPMMVATSRRTG